MTFCLRVALCLSLALTAAFWWERSSYRHRSAEVARLISRRVMPFQLAGLQLPLPQLVRLDEGAQFARHATRHVIFVLSDSCRFCQEALPALCALAGSPALTSRDEVLFVSLDGLSLARQLAACGRATSAHHVVGVPVNQTEFIMTTAMAATPAAVLADSQWRIRRSFVNGQFDELESALRSDHP